MFGTFLGKKRTNLFICNSGKRLNVNSIPYHLPLQSK